MRTIPFGQGSIGHVADTGQPYLCADTHDDPYFNQAANDLGSKSEIAVPMYAGTLVSGVINVESNAAGAFTEDDVITLGVIADQAGIALQNARLYEMEAELRHRAEARARRLEHIQRLGERLKLDLDDREVGIGVVSAAREAVNFKMAVLNLFDRPGDPEGRARVVATWTPPLQNSGEDAWRAGDELLVPLTDPHGGSLVGFLSVDDPDNGRRPEREVVEALEIFADQAVVALRNARLLAQVRDQAARDPVTGLLNYRAANSRLDASLSASLERAEPMSLIALDVDNFKLINDTHGHLVGDSALRHVAQLLQLCVRADDAVARLGGDEFLVVLPGASVDHAMDVVQRLMAAIQEMPLPIEGTGTVPLRLNAGISACPDDAIQPHALQAIADARLYEAKRSGGQAVELGTRGSSGGEQDYDGLDMLSALVTAVDNKDRYSREHSDHVAAFACELADVLGLSLENQRTLRIAGLLHDVGKIGVPDRILRKPGPLEQHEWEAMKQHVTLSTTLLRTVGFDAGVLAAVAHHHERWDGQGYPAGLAGTDVPLLGRIMILADAVAAMSADRPYRAGLSLDTIVQELRAHSGKQFDPTLVEPFITALLRAPTGKRSGVL